MADAVCVGFGLGLAELFAGVGAGAVVGAGEVSLAVVRCAFGRPDDETGGRRVVLVPFGAGWVGAERAGAVVIGDLGRVTGARVAVSDADG